MKTRAASQRQPRNHMTMAPRAPPPLQPFVSVQQNSIMTEISTAEISEYENNGFVVLRKRIDHLHIQKARDVVTTKIEDTRKTNKEGSFFATVCEDKNWPSECQALFDIIEVGVQQPDQALLN